MSSGEFSNYSLIQQHGRKVAAFKVNSSWIKRSRLLVSSITCIDNSSACNLCPSSRLLAQRMGGCTQQKRTSRLEQHSQRQANLSCVSQQRHQKPLAMHHRSLLMTLLIHQRASTRITIPSLFTVGATYHIFIPFFGNSRLYILHPPPNPLLSPTTIHLPPEYIFYPSSILLSINIMYPDLYIHFYLLSNLNSASDQQVLAPKL